MALFISCGSDEPPSNFCDFVVCQNGGTCNGESCDCPLGFMGIDCAVQMEPVAIEVKDIVLSQFSATDINGDTWDDDPEEWFPAFADNEWPDIYVVVSNQTGIIYNKTNPNVLNVENDQMTTLELFNPMITIARSISLFIFNSLIKVK